MFKFIIFLSVLFISVSSAAQKSSGVDSTQQSEELAASPALFRGGKEEMLKYIRVHLRYPESAIKNKIQGNVLVRFIVDEEGKISEVGIIRGLSKECDEEAMRIVNSMPPWIPARDSKREIVAAATSVTIEFKLPE